MYTSKRLLSLSEGTMQRGRSSIVDKRERLTNERCTQEAWGAFRVGEASCAVMAVGLPSSLQCEKQVHQEAAACSAAQYNGRVERRRAW